MVRRHFVRLSSALLLIFAISGTARFATGESVAVRRLQGTFHGFLTLKTLDGKVLGSGDLVQVAEGERITARLTYRFRDGSLDDETAVYSQRKVFSLISDHHVQRGPSFPKPIDLQIEVANGQVTVRDKDGKAKEEHMDLPPDLSNGLPLILLLNLDRADSVRLPMIVATPKPRLVHLAIMPEGEDSLSIGGVRHKAMNYRIKVELGGLAGAIAPIVGKQPADLHIWILGGEAPAFVKEEGEFYEGGPIWRVELAAPIFPKVGTQHPK
jgi:hypothetical protein